MIPQKVSAKLECLSLLRAIVQIVWAPPREQLKVAKRLVKRPACIGGPARLVIAVRKKTPGSGQ